MTEFLDFLAAYYTCDAMATLRPLNQDEMTGCMDVYEVVKRYFAPVFDLAPQGTAERAEQMQAAYLGFVEWQSDNADLVERMRADAAQVAAGEAPTAFR